MHQRTRTLALGLVLAAVALTPATALAKGGDDDGPGDDRGGRGGDRTAQTATGRCTDGSTVKLKAKHDDGRIETELEVDQNRNGVRWTVRLRRDGATVVTTSATTRAPSGSFSVERRIADPAGSNRITARATSPSGEVCTASVSV
jgi:hypothetical protein